MEQNGNVVREESFSQICLKIYAGVISVAVLAILVVFPLFYRNYYFDILQSKYKFYYITMIAMFSVILLLSLAFLVVDALEFRLVHVKSLLSRFSLKSLKSPQDMHGVMYWLLIIFLVVCIISTCQSDYLYESFWGNEGRYSGLFLHLIYIFGFLIVSRLYRVKEWHLWLFLAVGMFPLLFGITDYFKMDILNFKEEISSKDINAFTSTFGNINTYATFVGILFGMLSVLFVTEKKPWRATLYFIGYIITVFSMIMANSDNGILAFGLIFAFLPLLCLNFLQGVERYLWLLSGFFAACHSISWISVKMDGRVLKLEGVCKVLASLKFALPVAVFFGLLAFSFHVFRTLQTKKNGRQTEELDKRYLKIWIVFLVICFCTGMFILYDANWGGHSERYGALSNYLHFTDEWGTYRGMVWRISFESYAKQPFGHKLWGFGLDTFGVMTREYRAMTSSVNGQVYDSAHNEYLQYLVSVGPIGLLAYIGFLATALYIIIQRAKDNQWGIAIAAGVTCYLVQALVTINLPIVTPNMWMLLSIGVANVKKFSQ